MGLKLSPGVPWCHRQPAKFSTLYYIYSAPLYLILCLIRIQAYNYSLCPDLLFYELVTHMHTSTYLELVIASCLNWKKLVSDGVICWAHIFNTNGETLSGPHALLTSRLDNILKTSKSLKHILLRWSSQMIGMSGNWSCSLSSFCLNTDLKKSLNRHALPCGSVEPAESF